MQYNILLLQSQTERCEGDIYKYNSITNRQVSDARRTVPWDCTVTSDILEMENTIYTFAPIVILSVGCRLHSVCNHRSNP